MKRAIFVTLCLLLPILLTGCKDRPASITNPPEPPEAEIEQTKESLPMEYQDQGQGMIHINQLGYRSGDRKVAVINSQRYILESFELVRADTSEVVYTGQLEGKPADDGAGIAPVLDSASGDFVYTADFSEWSEPGDYMVVIPDYGSSYPFAIANDVYKTVKNAMLKNLYYQRCGMELEEEHAGVYTHGICHAELAVLYENQDVAIDVSGGWHDAGDYGRYVVPGANAAAVLLLAYELFPDRFGEPINLPESGNGVPDILNEVRYELEWLLRMQDPDSGGAYHKVTGRNFEDFIMPEHDHGQLVVLPVSPAATGDLAGVMAMASRIYNAFDPQFSIAALAAAEKAWAWLAANPDAPGYRNPLDVVTGEYGDDNASDETFWAAVELYKTTGKLEYHDYIKANYAAVDKLGLGWADIGGLGTLSYLFIHETQRDAEVYAALTEALLAEADQMTARAGQDGYQIPMAGADYGWGSNMTVMNKAVLLIAANRLQASAAYEQTAQNLFHYLLGRNALDKSYVSGFGSNPMMNPHHRPSASDGIDTPIPGLVSGGPNRNIQDPTAERFLSENKFPARGYVDNTGSWSTNETTIYWNAPAVFVAAYLDQ